MGSTCGSHTNPAHTSPLAFINRTPARAHSPSLFWQTSLQILLFLLPSSSFPLYPDFPFHVAILLCLFPEKIRHTFPIFFDDLTSRTFDSLRSTRLQPFKLFLLRIVLYILVSVVCDRT
ncbi:hypothetical protein ACSBR1_030134 [Camellia fascicularis]